MKISVLLAAYKGEQFIGEQLQSLVSQSRLPDEVLIGDDSGESQETFEAVEKFCRENPLPFDLQYFHNAAQKGVNENFRSLTEKASGDILFFCDQDDFWLPEKISRLSSELERDPQAEAVCCFSSLTDTSLSPWKLQDDSELQTAAAFCDHKEKLFQVFLSHKICGSGHNIAVRRSLIKKLPFWSPELLYDFWILQSCAAAQKLILVPERLTLRRIHQNNMTLSEQCYVGGRLNKRLNSILNSTGKHSEFERLLNERQVFLKELERSCLSPEIPAENMKKLRDAVTYLQRRLAYRKRFFLFRVFPSPVLLKGYFSYGNGWRSLLRDMAGL